MLDRLQRMHEEGIRKAAEHNEEIEQRYLQRVKDLEVEFADRRAELDTDAANERAMLAKKADELEARKQVLDDRDNTHARRAIRDSMLSDVKGRIAAFGVSHATEGKRRPVKVGIAVLGLALSCVLTFTLTDIWTYEHPGGLLAGAVSLAVAHDIAWWWLWIRAVLLSLGLAGTLMYYIRWQNKWADQHAQSEFALQQFYVDVNRANWVLESCLEWRKETESAIPGSLLDSITRGLFSASDKPDELQLNPADELAKALLGSASKLKVKAGDSELEFDKPEKVAKSIK